MPRSTVSTVCPYCAVGCGLQITTERGVATGIEYNPQHPVSHGALCPKGNASLEVINNKDRLTFPMKKVGDIWARISWEEALDLVGQRLSKALRDWGPESLGFLASSKCTNEENYLIEKLARTIGSRNVDNCARLCHAPSVVGLNRSLGAAGMTNPIPDLANSRCIFIIGSNLAENHPVITQWIHRAKDAGAVVIVADPRYTPTAWLADIFLQIRPGTDVALLNAMARLIIDEGWIDEKFIAARTTGYTGLVEALKGCSAEWAEGICGIPAQRIFQSAEAYALSPASSIVYSMGITQHTTGTDNVQALANLALICGQLGREGTGVLPLRGQNNVQGACDMGALAEFYPGYRPADDPATVESFSMAWDAQSLPLGRGLTAPEMIDGANDGRIKAMYIVGEDPVNSESNSRHVKEALSSLEFLVVQDIFMTSTSQLADLVLPAACWAEKEGTFTSTERRVQWTNLAVRPPGEARSDLWIVCEVANRMGLNFDYAGAEEVLSEINRTVPAYRGVTRSRLNATGIIWPCPNQDHPGTPILHIEAFKTMDGRGRILPVSFRHPAEGPSDEFPFTLTTGRIAVHHNAGSMTRRSPSLAEREPEPFAEINPMDARRLGISQGEMVNVTTARGMMEALARISERVPSGVVFMPFHFPGANILTSGARDEVAGIPEFKVAACNIARRD
ncbi:MAG: formate dehydrogenase subunit alpha [Methanotrichaceae archaeon]|nr:formate dehydrogenase subunit alpha [Methanotrichaceae archaeon]